MHKSRKNNPWIYFTYTQLAPKSLYSYKSCGEYYVTEYVELVLGRMAVLKISDWAMMLFEGNVLCFHRQKKSYFLKIILTSALKSCTS